MGVACSSEANAQDDALLAAIRDGDAATVQKNLANSRLKSGKYLFWADQVSALHVASNEGHLGVLQALVENARPGPEASTKEKHVFSAFLNRSNSYGQTALMLACKNGHVECVTYLLGQGADPLVPDKVHSRTGLHYAAWNGWAACIEVLLSETTRVRLFNGQMGGANDAIVTDPCGRQRLVDIRSESGFTPLHFAVSASNAAAVKVLLERGASFLAEVQAGACYSIWPTMSTPLHIAAAKGSVSVAKLLLEAQAHTPHISADTRTRQDSNGRRPLDIAQQLGHTRLEVMLDPATPLRHALSPHSRRHSRLQGCSPLTVLAGRAVQVALLGQLDYLAWQLRIRDGASAAMPSSLRRQLLKSKSARARSKLPPQRHGQPPLASPADPQTMEGFESMVSTDSEDKDPPGASPSAEEALQPSQQVVTAANPASAEGSRCGALAKGAGLPLSAQGSTTGGAHSECGVCLDRRTQLLIGECRHECCYDCGMTLVKKTKISKGSIRCPFCRGVIGSFHLKDKSNEPVMIGKRTP